MFIYVKVHILKAQRSKTNCSLGAEHRPDPGSNFQISFLGDPGPVSHYQPHLPHKVVVLRTKGGSETTLSSLEEKWYKNLKHKAHLQPLNSGPPPQVL